MMKSASWPRILCSLLCFALCLQGIASAQQFEMDPALKQMEQRKTKPLSTSPSNNTSSFKAKASDQKTVLQTGVTTIENAIIQEKDTVDWYSWYIACRQYLTYTGGLACSVGTMIRFNKNGMTQAMSYDSQCILSAAQKHFPLPKGTQLQAVLLPVRSAKAPPASPDELYHYIPKDTLH